MVMEKIFPKLSKFSLQINKKLSLKVTRNIIYKKMYLKKIVSKNS